MIGAHWATDPEALLARVAELPRPLVFTNGCFDILHRGHVTYLAQAAGLGASLLVAVNDDASVRAQEKGSGRPFNCLEDRMTVLAALQSVTMVVAFADHTPLSLIELVEPNVLVKGGDWQVADIVGAGEVQSRGGTVHSIPFVVERSTTSLINRIRGNG
jgi:rfaE bifunctional protein nucleotidyltransferase chain/domain